MPTNWDWYFFCELMQLCSVYFLIAFSERTLLNNFQMHFCSFFAQQIPSILMLIWLCFIVAMQQYQSSIHVIWNKNPTYLPHGTNVISSSIVSAGEWVQLVVLSRWGAWGMFNLPQYWWPMFISEMLSSAVVNNYNHVSSSLCISHFALLPFSMFAFPFVFFSPDSLLHRQNMTSWHIKAKSISYLSGFYYIFFIANIFIALLVLELGIAIGWWRYYCCCKIPRKQEIVFCVSLVYFLFKRFYCKIENLFKNCVGFIAWFNNF